MEESTPVDKEDSSSTASNSSNDDESIKKDLINSELNAGLLKRSESFDAMVNKLTSDSVEHNIGSQKLRPTTIAATHEETWDFTLRAQPSSTDNDQLQSNSKGGTIWLGDIDFQRKLEEYNVFETCTHEVIKIPCPCSNKTPFSICAKCHRVFCSNKCLRQTKEDQSQVSKVETDVQAKPTSVGDDGDLILSRKTTSKSSPQSLLQQCQLIMSSPKKPESTIVVRKIESAVRPIMQTSNARHSQFESSQNSIRMSSPRQFSSSQGGTYINQPILPKGDTGLLGAYQNPNLPFQSQGGYPMPPHVGMVLPRQTVSQNSIPYNTYRPQNPSKFSTTGLHSNSNSSQLASMPSYNNVNMQSPRPMHNINHVQPLMQPRGLRVNSQNRAVFSPPSAANQIRYNTEVEPPNGQTMRNEPGPNWSNSQNVQQTVDNGPKNSAPSRKISPSTKNELSSTSEEWTGKYEPTANINQLQKFRGVGRGFQNKSAESNNNVREMTNRIGSAHSPVTPIVKQLPNSQSSAPFNPTTVTPPTTCPYSNENNSHQTKGGTTTAKYKTPFSNPIKGTGSILKQNVLPIPRETIVGPPMQAQPVSHNSRSANALDDQIYCDPYVFYGVPMQAVYSYGDSLFDFYVWSGVGCNSNHSILEELTSLGETTLQLKSAIVGECCIAKYTNVDDGVDGWFRARIIDVVGDQIRVYFIDYGNKEVVSRNLIKTLPDSLRRMRPSAIRIGIGDFQPTVETSELRSIFNKYILEQKFRITIFEKQPANMCKNTIEHDILKAKFEIKHDGQWVGLADILENARFGHKVSFGTRVFKKNQNKCDDCSSFNDVHREIPVKIGHFNNPNDFYVIPEDRAKDKDIIMRKLNTKNVKFDAFKIEKWIDTNYICISKRSEHEWARAKIIEITEDWKVLIRFIDFGDSIEKSPENLKCVPAALLSIPQLAYRCSLPIFPAQGEWNLTDPDVTILNEIQSMNSPIVIIVFALEIEISVHIVEVYQGDNVRGLSKSLLKKKKSDCLQEYEVNLDIRKTIHKLNERTVPTPQTEIAIATKIETQPFPSYSEAPRSNKSEKVSPANAVKKSTVLTESGILLPNVEPSNSLHDFRNSEFKITFTAGYNEFYIQPTSFTETAMRLQEEIIECVDSGKSFKTPPPFGSIVIAPYKDGNFHRAIVTKISSSKVWVQFIDIGDRLKIPLQKLVPASDNTLKFPKFVYHVKLVDVEDDPKLLLLEDFIEIMKNVTKMTFGMEMCNGDQEPYLISLRQKDATKGDTISKRILSKQIWEWESVFNAGYTVDTTLLASSKYREFPPNPELIQMVQLPVGAKVKGEVSRHSSEGDIFIVNIQYDILRRNHEVLESQIARFVEKVAATPFLPKIQELFLLFIPDIPETRKMNIHGIGKWNRCLRETSTYFRSIDYDEVYPMEAELSEHFEYRKISPEFVQRVAVGLAECRLKDYKPSTLINERMNVELVPRKPVTFFVDHYDEDDSMYVITIDSLKL